MIDLRSPQPATARAMRAVTALTLAVATLTVTAAPAWADTVLLPAATNAATGTAAKINDIKLTPGNLYYEDDRDSLSTTTPTRSLFRRAAAQSAGVVSIGAETPIASPVGTFLSASGDRYAYSNTANTILIIVGPGSSTRTVPLSPSTTTDVKLSGSSLLISTTVGDTLTDLVTGSAQTLPANTNLFGRYAVWFNADGSVDRRDLTAATTLRVRAPGVANPCTLAVPCTTAAAKTSAKVWGNWVLWRFDCETKAVNITTGATRTLPCSKGTSVGNDVAVSKDTAVPANLVLQDLTTSTSPVPTTTLASDVKKFSLDDRLVAYSDATTNTLSVVSIPPTTTTGSAHLLTADAAPAISPNGDGSGDAWTPELDFTKALDSWAVTISDSTGTAIRHLASTAPATTGTVRPVWDGTDDIGAALPDGAYTWAFTGVAADGDGGTVGDDGTQHGLTGTITIQRTPPTATVTSPALSTSTSAAATVGVAWTPSAASLPGNSAKSYDIRVAANHSTTYTTWLTKTMLRTAIYRATPGTTYRFQVRAWDNAGNVGPWSATSTTVVPVDDRSAAMKYSGTWTLSSVTSAFLKTEKVSATKGAKLTLVATMSAVRIITRTCALCGRFTVMIDGRVVATIDTRSTVTRYRQLVYSRTISATPGKHTLTLLVAGTARRPRIYLDAVGALR